MAARPTVRVLLAAAAVAATAAAVLTAPSGLASSSPHAKGDRLCAPDRAAVVHRAGGQRLAQKPVRVPCGSETGYYTGETGIAVTNNGSVWFSAADWEWAMVRSTDNGHSWERAAAGGPQAMPGCFVATSPATCQDSEAAKNGTSPTPTCTSTRSRPSCSGARPTGWPSAPACR